MAIDLYEGIMHHLNVLNVLNVSNNDGVQHLKDQIQPMANYCWGDWLVYETPKQKESGLHQIWYRIVPSFYNWRDIVQSYGMGQI